MEQKYKEEAEEAKRRDILKKIEAKKEQYPWMKDMEFDEKGNICKNADNIIEFLNKHPMFEGKLKYNDYLKRKEIDGREFNDFDQNNIYVNIERCLGFDARLKADAALSEIFNTHKYNPVVDYLKNLAWDKENRIETLMIKLFDINDTPLNRLMSKNWFIAAVKRVFEPGCKFDNIIVLQGGQGIGKSTFCEKISKGYYSQISMDELSNDKDLVDKLNKTWIAIIDELDGFGKKDMKNIKSFLSESSKTVRLAYERNSQTFYRHCVFIGSTNDDTFLRDNTSSVERRFWVLKCNKTSMDSAVSDYLTDEIINQLWAESVYYYFNNKDIYLDIPKEYYSDFENQQRQFKTFNDDESTEWANDILNKQYILNNKGCFSDENDFFSQVNGTRTYNEQFKEYINKIPSSWLTQVLQRNYGLKVQTKSLTQALEENWDYKNAKYNGIAKKCFVRKNEIKVSNNDEDTQNSLPF